MKYSKRRLKILAEELTQWIKDDENFWVNSFAVEKGITIIKFKELVDSDETLSDAYKLAKDTQECKIIDMGMKKSGNATFISFILKNVHGWKTNPDTIPEGDEKVPMIQFVTKEE
jgi:hypothetical protein